MKKNEPPADDGRLGVLMREARPSPGLPPGFRQSVWRRIEAGETRSNNESWLDAVANLILRPRFAMAAAVVVLLAGILTGAMEGRQMVRQDARMNYLASVAPQSAR